MSYISLYDILESILRYKKIDEEIIKNVRLCDRELLMSIIDRGIREGALQLKNDKLELILPLNFIMLLDDMGINTTYLSNYISWQEFENYVADQFMKYGWETFIEYHHRHIKTFQVDVIAVNMIKKLALFIECKHWHREVLGQRTLENIVSNHIRRIEKYLRVCEWVVSNIPYLRKVKYILPIIITLKRFSTKVFRGIPIISIRYLHDFILNIDVYIDSLNLKLYENRCYIE